MIMNSVDAMQARLPLLAEDWRRRAPHLCDDFDADFLLIDPGSGGNQPRYTIIGLRAAHSLHYCESLAEVQASHEDGGLDVESMLMVPLHREHGRHQGHIGLLYRDRRSFDRADVERLQSASGEVLNFLKDH